MFRNYFKIAFRNLSRNKGFSVTNILGLTIGITCAMLILLWVKDELSYNKFQKNYDSVYEVMANRDFNNKIFTDESMVMPFANAIGNEIPQVKHAVVTTEKESHLIGYGDTKLKKEGYTVSDHFFDIFSWSFIKGNASNPLPDAYSIVLTESFAKTIFGDADPINKVIRIDNEYDAKVTAVVADPPGNSTLQFDFINSFNYSGDYIKSAMNNWKNSSWLLYVQPVIGANLSSIEKKINEIKIKHDPDDKKISTYFFFPMNKWRLYSDFKDGKNIGGMIEYVRLFSIIALIILLTACVNFMNLSTARSEKRAKEVGIRKTLGSDKKQLVFQFFFESMILTTLAFLISAIAVFLLLPSFNTLVAKQLTLNIKEPFIWVAALVIILFTGIVAGSYPALYLSSFNPIKVLKGTFLAGRKAVLPRRILVIGQFIISIVLISATIIVYQQIQHVKNRGLGYNPDNIIMIPSSPDVVKNYPVIKQQLLTTGLISSVTRAFSPMTEIWWRSPAPDWDGKAAGVDMIVTGFSTDLDFTKTMGVKMLQGKDFTGVPSDSSAIMLNKAAVEVMGLKNPIGRQLRYDKRIYTITGVMDNIVMESPYKAVDPMMIYFRPHDANLVNIRLNPSIQPQKTLKSIEAVFKKFNPSVPFEYQFVDKEFGKKFLSEELISKLTNIFAGLAIFICCIGLAGLASFTIEKRIREIGIRKVLGASVRQLLMLLSKEFLKLVLIAFLIAVPVTWLLMNSWLEKYAYHVTISIWLFIAVGSAIMLLTIVVVSLNTIRAAISNPVKSLRSE